MSATYPDLVALFDNLTTPTIDVGLGRFCIQRIPGYPACAVGKDTSGYPALLIETRNALPASGAPLVLESLSIIHQVNCRVQSGELEQQRTLSIIRCTGTERELQEYFLRCIYPIISVLPNAPMPEQVTQVVERLVELFRKMVEPPRKALAGLWAELLVISRAIKPAALIASWHAIPEERFDFSSGVDRIDVKAACGAVRAHHFSLEQLRPASHARVLILSTLLDRSEGGLSVNDLVDTIRQRVSDPDSLLRLDSVVATTLGDDWRSMRDVRYDLQLAAQSLRLVDASRIPSVSTPVPPELSEIHFRVDLSHLALDSPVALIRSSALFQAVASAADKNS